VRGNTLYTDAGGYGWLTPVSGFDRGANASPAYSDLLRDGHWHWSARDFQVDLQPGDYEVTVTFGDPSYGRDKMWVAVVTGSGAGLANVDAPRGQLVHRTFAASTADDGRLVLRFGDAGGDPYWTVAALEIRPAAAELAISGPAGTPEADGNTVDSFEVGAVTPGRLYTVSTSFGALVQADGSPLADADPIYAGVQVIGPPSGAVTFGVRRPSTGGQATVVVEAVTGEARGATTINYASPTLRRLDFGTMTGGVAGSPAADGFTAIGPAVYDPRLGYGWQTAAYSFSRSGPDALLRDGHWGTDNTFLVDMAPGDYLVNVTLGDASYVRNFLDVFVNGQLEIDDLATPAGQFVHATTGIVSTVNGQLAIRIKSSGGDPYFTVNAIEVFPAPAAPLSLAGALGAADGTTIDTITVSGATDGALYTVRVDLGTTQGVDASAAYAGFQVLAAGANFTFELQRPTGIGSGEPKIRVEEVTGRKHGQLDQVYTLADVRRFDFNGPVNSTQAGLGFWGLRGDTLYTDARGYGWTASVYEFERATTSMGSDALYRDGHWGWAERTFRVQVDPSADYDVRMYIGDAGYARDNIQISVDGGSTWVTAPATAKNVFTTVLIQDVNAFRGKLDIRIRNHGGDPYWVVNGMDVWKVANAAGDPDPNDPAAATLLPAGKMVDSAPDAVLLTNADLQLVLPYAIAAWAAAGLNAPQQKALSRVPIEICDLSSREALGMATPEAVWIDDDAAGYGWRIDPAQRAGSTFGDIDLLSVVTHELGHVLGLGHDDPYEVMAATLAPGLRTVSTPASPWEAQFVRAFLDRRGSRSLFATPFPSLFEPLSRESPDTEWASSAVFPAVRARDEFFAAIAIQPRRSVASKAEFGRFAHDDDRSEVADWLYDLLTGVMADGVPSDDTQDGLLDEDVLEILMDAQAQS
jgi:hypothetical protein